MAGFARAPMKSGGSPRKAPPSATWSGRLPWSAWAAPEWASFRPSPLRAPEIRIWRRAADQGPLEGHTAPPERVGISSASDPAEREAEALAESLVGGSATDAAAPGAIRPTDATTIHRRCEECDAEDDDVGPAEIQRRGERTSIAAADVAGAASAVRGGGDPLPAHERRFFEDRLGYDLSEVRIHTDRGAAEAARAIHADAFTLRGDIAFADGRYAPGNPAGRRLLAHELGHVVQQGAAAPRSDRPALGLSAGQGPRIARQNTGASTGVTTVPPTVTPASVSTATGRNAVDATAQAIVTFAQDATIPLAQRAPQLGQRILSTYFPADAGLVERFVYDAADTGLTARCPRVSTPHPSLRCPIKVGDAYVQETTRTGISRRVLQLGHELDHIRQHRAGMGGDAQKHLREFLSFFNEATNLEAAGTGRMQHATRVSLIDQALRHYNCFSPAEKTAHAARYQRLVALRGTEQTASGNTATPIPTDCAPR